MAKRIITKTGKDDKGNITRVCNPSEGWSPRNTLDVIRDIDSLLHNYWVGTAEVIVARGPAGKHIRTKPDSAPENNLDNLPDC